MYICFWRQYVSLFASITATVSLFLTSDRESSHCIYWPRNKYAYALLLLLILTAQCPCPSSGRSRNSTRITPINIAYQQIFSIPVKQLTGLFPAFIKAIFIPGDILSVLWILMTFYFTPARRNQNQLYRPHLFLSSHVNMMTYVTHGLKWEMVVVENPVLSPTK